MTDFKRILRKGEEVKNPTDSCEMYMCIVSVRSAALAIDNLKIRYEIIL